jgi:hypothetical protein
MSELDMVIVHHGKTRLMNANMPPTIPI